MDISYLIRRFTKRLRYRFLVWFFKDLIQEELTEALHPEFGWWWREDEDGGKAVKRAYENGYVDGRKLFQ